MFRIEKEPKFWHTVTVLTPIDDDTHREDTFRARFLVRPSEEIEAYDLRVAEDVRNLLLATVVDLDDITDDDDHPLPFSQELLRQMLGNYAARMAMLNTYIAAITKARVGN
ncbi:hypothetical protein [Roseobacter sp. S98]|uniref:hypothetical protein n=1 Tax=Roseobacter algicola (ex Choi et al. 2025) (nom. illeg.) TaxID=3092138 RepID=UPI0035C67590